MGRFQIGCRFFLTNNQRWLAGHFLASGQCGNFENRLQICSGCLMGNSDEENGNAASGTDGYVASNGEGSVATPGSGQVFPVPTLEACFNTGHVSPHLMPVSTQGESRISSRGKVI